MKYTLTLIFSPDKTKVLMCYHIHQKALNYIGGKINPEEDQMDASYRELEEETGITRDDVTLTYLQTEEATSDYGSPNWYLYITCGILKHNVTLRQEKNPLTWVSVTNRDTLLWDTFGEGNCYVFMKRALNMMADIQGREER